MKKLICTLVVILAFVFAHAQATQIPFDCNKKPSNKTEGQHFTEGANVEIILKGKSDSIKKYFTHSLFLNEHFESSLFELLKEGNNSLVSEDRYFTDSVEQKSDGSAQLKIVLTQSLYGTGSVFSILFSNDGKIADTVKLIKIEPAVDTGDNGKTITGSENLVIDAAMTAGINGSESCQLCDLYAKKVAIESKHDRIYSTDYIIIYDPSLKKDAYTICKHFFEKNKGGADGKKINERYIKIGAMWFAPKVGSQIRFEVVNQPLNKPLKLTVDEQDVFNNGSTQFASLISGLVTANITTPVSGKAKEGGNKDLVAGGGKIPEKLSQVAGEILQYVIQFRVSSCAMQQHYANLTTIITRMNNNFETNASNADQLGIQLAKKIEADLKDDPRKAKASKDAETIISALKSLENVQPIAYTTLRAKNRDFIEVKYTDANNVTSKPENIRMSGGMKIDFSAGFILTGLKDNTYALKNATVQYKPLNSTVLRDTTGNVIVKEDDGKNQVGVALLTHFYPRISSHYNIGGTVGLMTSTSLNLRVMLGGSVMVSSLFGSNNRVSFSGGIVWGKVKRLSIQNEDYFNRPRTVNGQPEFYSQATAPQPIDRSEHSWFFAITMNFGGN